MYSKLKYILFKILNWLWNYIITKITPVFYFKIWLKKKKTHCLNVQWACKNLPNVFRYCKEKKKKTQKSRHSNIRTFEMPKILKNKKIYCQKIIENIYIYTHTNLCVCVTIQSRNIWERRVILKKKKKINRYSHWNFPNIFKYWKKKKN